MDISRSRIIGKNQVTPLGRTFEQHYINLWNLQNEIPISCDFAQFGPEERSGLRVQRVATFTNRNSEYISKGLLVSFQVSVVVTFDRFKHYT